MAQTPTKINKYSLADLKNTTDDSIPAYLNSIGYKQIHTLTDVRLALGFSACAIAAATFYYDFKFGFEATKSLTMYAVVVYFILNTALTWWMWWVEGGTVYVGQKDGIKIEVSTSVDKHTPNYHVKVKTSGPKVKAGRDHTVSRKGQFTSWFDENGFFVPKPFQTFLDGCIPDVAARKLVEEKRREQESNN